MLRQQLAFEVRPQIEIRSILQIEADLGSSSALLTGPGCPLTCCFRILSLAGFNASSLGPAAVRAEAGSQPPAEPEYGSTLHCTALPVRQASTSPASTRQRTKELLPGKRGKPDMRASTALTYNWLFIVPCFSQPSTLTRCGPPSAFSRRTSENRECRKAEEGRMPRMPCVYTPHSSLGIERKPDKSREAPTVILAVVTGFD